MNKVQKIKDMIEAGEAIQVVLSDYLEIDNLDPFQFYRNLRKINPSPYMFFIKDGGSFVVGSSPEVHIRVRGKYGLPAAYRRHETKRGIGQCR